MNRQFTNGNRHEKMLTFTPRQGNANKNTMRFYFISGRITKIQKSEQLMAARMWGKGSITLCWYWERKLGGQQGSKAK